MILSSFHISNPLKQDLDEVPDTILKKQKGKKQLKLTKIAKKK